MNIPWLVQSVLLPLVAIAVMLTFVRILRGPSLPDRVIAFDLLATLGIALLAGQAVVAEETALLDICLLLALVTFVGTVAFARYLERRVQP